MVTMDGLMRAMVNNPVPLLVMAAVGTVLLVVARFLNPYSSRRTRRYSTQAPLGSPTRIVSLLLTILGSVLVVLGTLPFAFAGMRALSRHA